MIMDRAGGEFEEDESSTRNKADTTREKALRPTQFEPLQLFLILTS